MGEEARGASVREGQEVILGSAGLWSRPAGTQGPLYLSVPI